MITNFLKASPIKLVGMITEKNVIQLTHLLFMYKFKIHGIFSEVLASPLIYIKLYTILISALEIPLSSVQLYLTQVEIIFVVSLSYAYFIFNLNKKRKPNQR